MRLYALAAGVWFSSLQLTLIYAVSFLHSATLPAYLSIMAGWFLGSGAGCRLPERWSNRGLCGLALIAHELNSWLLSQSGGRFPSWLPAAFLGGVAGGHWVRRWTRAEFAGSLSWESLGLALGTGLAALSVYRFGLGGIYGLPLVVSGVLLVVRRSVRVP